MSQPEPGFDPDRLMTALQTKTVDEWGLCASGLTGGNLRASTIRKAIMETYRQLPVEAA
jgi:hypothetical protein